MRKVAVLEPAAQSPSMDPKQVTPRRKRSRLSKWITTFALAVLFCPIILFLVLGVWRNSVLRDNARHIAAIQAAGHPVHPSELTNWFATVPKDKNAAAVYVQAFGALVNPIAVNDFYASIYAPYPPHTVSLSNQLKRKFEATIAANQTALRLMHEAADRERCAFFVNLDRVISYRPPHYSILKKAAVLLEIEGVLHAEAGRADESFQSCRAMLAVARSLDDEPLLESLRTRSQLRKRSARLIERMIDRLHLSSAHLEQISFDLSRAETNNLLPRAIAADRAIHLPLFDLPLARVNRLLAPRRGERVDAEEEPDADEFDLEETLYRVAGWGARDQRLYLRLTDTNLAAARMPFPAALDCFKSGESILTNSSAYASRLSWEFLKVMADVFDPEAAGLAELRCTQTVVAVERHRLAHGGRLPETLAALVPTFLQRVPEDPYDGKPVRYQIRANGYSVYSVGTDRKDDGGRRFAPYPNTPEATSETSDITFEVTR